MSLIEEYYELNEAEEVSAVWKTLQIGFYASAACLGLGCGFTLAFARLSFDDRCYLFSEVKTSFLKDDKSEKNIIWESDTWCDYYQFTMVFSFIVAIIWATFFLMCGKGGKSLMGLPQPWRIVWPSLIFNLIYCIITLSTAIGIQQGTDIFCGRKNFDKLHSVKSLIERCETLKIFLKKKDVYKMSIQLEIVVKTSWGCVGTWFILFLLSLFRIVFGIDFNLYKVCVFKFDETVQNKREEVLRITNYEEPRKLSNEKKIGGNSNFENETLEDLEAGIRKKKIEKKLMHHYYDTMYRFPLQKNATFYVTPDLRLPRGEKKEDKYSKALNETFVETELRKPIGIQMSLDISPNSSLQTFLYQRSNILNNIRNDGNEMNSPSASQKRNLNEEHKESRSDNELFVSDSESNFLMSKKQI